MACKHSWLHLSPQLHSSQSYTNHHCELSTSHDLRWKNAPRAAVHQPHFRYKSLTVTKSFEGRSALDQLVAWPHSRNPTGLGTTGTWVRHWDSQNVSVCVCVLCFCLGTHRFQMA